MLKGTKASKETREKISLALLGNKRNLGKFHYLGKKMKMRLKKLGKKLSEEHKKKISLSLMGNKYSLGRKYSREEIQKIRQKNTGNGNPMFGKHHSEETKLKISEKRKKYFIDNPEQRIIKSLIRRGNKHFNWQGGITPLNTTIRNLAKFSDWRKSVYRRDNYTCQVCGITGVQINADHEISFSELLKSGNVRTLEEAINYQPLWDIQNGRTLCIPCHKQTATFAGRTRKLIYN